jgi:hypothetical protein
MTWTRIDSDETDGTIDASYEKMLSETSRETLRFYQGQNTPKDKVHVMHCKMKAGDETIGELLGELIGELDDPNAVIWEYDSVTDKCLLVDDVYNIYGIKLTKNNRRLERVVNTLKDILCGIK